MRGSRARLRASLWRSGARLRASLRPSRARPAIVWTAALLFLCGSLRCALAVAAPVSSNEPIAVAGAIGLVAGLTAGGLWWWGDRLRVGAFQALVVATTLMVSALVAVSHDRGGMLLTAFAYPWIAVYSAHFFKRRAVAAEVLLIGLAFGVALVLGDHHQRIVVPWVMVMGTVGTLAWIVVRLNETLRRQADTDQLTGLLNRSGFLAAAGRARATAARSGEPLTVVVLDLDGFKQVNDRLGHAAGDRLLERLGAEWRARLRGGDILARHGGDEFVLLLPDTSAHGAREALARLQVPDMAVNWSVGVSQWRPGEEIDDCLARADRNLYESKDLVREGGTAPAVLVGLR